MFFVYFVSDVTIACGCSVFFYRDLILEWKNGENACFGGNLMD